MVHTPHFFQPLSPDILANFFIPTAFLKHLGHTESNTGNDFVAVLRDKKRSSTGNGEPKTWHVKVDGDGGRFLDGWKEFAKDHSLRVGDFLVFDYLGGFLFEVLVFDPISACPRSFSFSVEKTGDVESRWKKKRAMPTEERAKFKPSSHPYFCASVKPYCFKEDKMYIPAPFAKLNNLEERRCEMILIDQKGRTWHACLRQTISMNGRRCVYLCTGWKEPAFANKLEVGDSVVYELIDSGTLPVMKFYKV